ncbi:MAG: UDP-3-O-(3-hydroxymyristoyl)glucosamine N-acyltransferase [Xanthomonadales bacterium]|nr:UDP-3-O-(3-hydroxymyristoyl)glucosamine N-acyltransferase [Xanthomonadales bacterium]
MLTLAEIAAQTGCAVHGDPDTRVSRVATLAGAGADSLSFLANARYRSQLASTAAAAVVVNEADLPACPVPALVARDPYAVYARAASLLHPAPRREPGISPGAHVDATAQVHPSASIAPGAVVEAGASIGARTQVGPGSCVGAGCTIGSDCLLAANVTLYPGVSLADRVTVHSGAVIGSDGFGFAQAEGAWIKVPQVGSVRIGSDVEIGASTTIDCGAIEDTVIEEGVKLDNQIQIAHNVHIGAHTVIAACSGVSGSTRIGKRCMVGGAVGFVGHLTIADDVIITGQTMVNRSISEAGVYSSALPMDEARRWRRNSARFRQLDQMAKDLRTLMKKNRD